MDMNLRTKDFEQRNLREEGKSEPKHVNLWFAVNCLRIETFLSWPKLFFGLPILALS